MMFDWNDQDQVGDTIWAEFGGSEDHIVPYRKGTEDNNNNNNNNNNSDSNNNSSSTFLNYGDDDKKKKNEDSNNIIVYTDQNSGAKSDFEGCNLENQSELQSKLDMESWPDLPALNAPLGRDYNNGDEQDNIASTYLNDFNSTPNLDEVGVQLDGETEAFNNGNGDKSNSFLDCDWGNIGDLDDFDRLFSNGDYVFGNEMVGNGGEFLSGSSDVISSTVQSIPMPNVSFNKGQSSDHGSSSVQFNEPSPVKSKPEEKVDTEKKLVKSHKKGDERGKSKAPQSIITVPPLSPALNSPANFVFPGYGYPAYQFPAIPVTPKPAPAPASVTGYKNSDSIEKKSDISNARAVIMTPKEKIEKLRRRQQMQAMLAIQQQQQQLGHQVSGNDNLVPQSSPRNLKTNQDSLASSAILVEGLTPNKGFTTEQNTQQDELSRGSVTGLTTDPHIEESIFYQFQDAISKLDVKIRLCIRDSLLRLARSVMERQNTSDRSSTSKSNNNEETESSENDKSNRKKRCAKIGEAETGTNPIDRTVAHLLFHKLSEKSSSQVKEEIPSSPVSLNPDLKVSASKSKENWKNVGQMEVQVQP